MNLQVDFLLLHWPNSSPHPFQALSTHELTFDLEKSSVPRRFGEKP